jgi:hypothetical protein
MKYEKSAQIAEETFEWCCRFLGTPLKRYPKLKLSTDKRYTRKYGEYNNKVITIYLNTCKGRKDIIGTVIHEYTHFIQMPRKKDINKYHILSKNHHYNKHPFEIEAVLSEKFHLKDCIDYLRKKGHI